LNDPQSDVPRASACIMRGLNYRIARAAEQAKKGVVTPATNCLKKAVGRMQQDRFALKQAELCEKMVNKCKQANVNVNHDQACRMPMRVPGSPDPDTHSQAGSASGSGSRTKPGGEGYGTNPNGPRATPGTPHGGLNEARP